MEQFESFIGVNFWTALFTLLNFLAVFYVGKRFLVGPVLKIVSDRQKEIDDLYNDAGASQRAAQTLQSEYAQKLSAAEQTSQQLVKEAINRGHAREEEIIRQARAEADAIMDKAAADIAMEKNKALNDAKDQIADMAIAIAEKVVGRELTTADQARMVDVFIDELGGQL